MEAEATARVAANTGLDVTLEVSDVRAFTEEAEDGSQSATRHFVVFEGALDGEAPDEIPTDDATDPAAEAGWFAELPEDAAEVPGTGLLLD